MSSDLGAKMEEELKKEEAQVQAQQQIQLPPTRPIKPTVEKAELESVRQQASRYEEDLYRYGYGEYGEMPLLAPGILDRISPEQLAKLLEGGDESKTILMLYILDEMSMNRFMRWLILQDWLETRKARAMQVYKPPSDSLGEIMRDLVKTLVSQAGSRDLNTLKEIASIAKDIASIRSATGSEELKEVLEEIRKVVEEVKEGRKNPRQALEEIKTMVSALKDIAEIFRPSAPTLPGQTTATPLTYQGSAPWIFHPDARQALKDFIDSIGTNLAKIFLAVKGVSGMKTPPLKMGSGSGSEVPKDLLL